MATLKYSVSKYEYKFTGTDDEIDREGTKVEKRFKDFNITKYFIYYCYDNKQIINIKK